MTDFAFRNYDAWKLDSPPEDDMPECCDEPFWQYPHLCKCIECFNCGDFRTCPPCAKADMAGL